jgi:rubrerythrin
MEMQQLKELLLQSLEHERAGVDVYETAIRCAVSEDLKHQWSDYLEQTHSHAAILEGVLSKLEIDPEHASPGRRIVRSLGNALVMAMETAKASSDRMAAQLVACECIVLAETKDHMNWELLTKCAERLGGAQKQALEEACEIVEEQEDEHLYHSRGYCRELWLDALGLPAMLPPPEEMQHVRSAVSAAQAQQQSERNR